MAGVSRRSARQDGWSEEARYLDGRSQEASWVQVVRAKRADLARWLLSRRLSCGAAVQSNKLIARNYEYVNSTMMSEQNGGSAS